MISNEDKEQELRMLANSYLEMKKFHAWGHLMDYISGLKESATIEIDQKDRDEISSVDMGWVKGVRETVGKIQRHIENAINEAV